MVVVVKRWETPLELWACFTKQQIDDIVKEHAIPLCLSDGNWLTFRITREAACDRARWFQEVPKEDLIFLRVLVTAAGVGHFTLEGSLTRKPEHGTWRFHKDMPFVVFDDEGNLLLSVDSDVRCFA